MEDSGLPLKAKARSLRVGKNSWAVLWSSGNSSYESQSNPGINMVHPEPGEELRRRSQLFLAVTAPY